MNTQTNHKITKWLDLRQTMLRHYFELSHTKTKVNTQHFTIFIETLIDYVSTGHFSLFEHLTHPKANAKPSHQRLVDKLYSKILTTTHSIVDWHDVHTISDSECMQAFDITEELSRIGEIIASRLELEDKLIKTWDGAHA